MKEGWTSKPIDEACLVEYGERVVKKRDGGTIYPVYGGGGATFFMDRFNREDAIIIARFGLSEKCTRFVKGKFFLNDSGLSVKPRNPEELSEEFLRYLMFSLQKEIYSLARGTAQKNLNVPTFRKMVINYPSDINEQKRIVAILDEAFVALKTAKKNTEKNLENAQELFDSCLNKVFVEEGDDWHSTKLKLLTTKIGSGATPRGGKKAYKQKGISLIRSMNVHDNRFKYDKLAHIDEKQAGLLDNVTIRNSDVLLNITGASVARCCMVPDDVIPARVNQHVSIIRPKQDIINPHFLCYLLTSKKYKDQLLQTGEKGGSTRQAITKKQIQEFVISYPEDMNKQKSVIESIDSIHNNTLSLKKTLLRKASDLDQLRDAILNKAFSGEMEVSV